jgi:hypothetical protein
VKLAIPTTVDTPPDSTCGKFADNRVVAATVAPDRDHFWSFSFANRETRENFRSASPSLTDH